MLKTKPGPNSENAFQPPSIKEMIMPVSAIKIRIEDVKLNFSKIESPSNLLIVIVLFIGKINTASGYSKEAIFKEALSKKIYSVKITTSGIGSQLKVDVSFNERIHRLIKNGFAIGS
ncbi:hypothetical protein VCR3J2_30054 [Vibrio coralliirubri]|nr:hypothetical protein VCR3J2_30054 [Vibrio coralliirubri]